jgi:hypothetical protein
MYKMYIMEIEIQRKESSNQNKKGPSKLITKSYPKSKARKNSSKIQHYPLLIKIKNYIKRTPLCVFLIQQGYDFAFPVSKTYKYHSPKDPTTGTQPKICYEKSARDAYSFLASKNAPSLYNHQNPNKITEMHKNNQCSLTTTSTESVPKSIRKTNNETQVTILILYLT